LSKKDIKLYDYQEELVKSVEATLAFDGDGDYFVDSCVSSGKSFMMAALANEVTGRVVILISITSLLDQIAEHLDLFEEEYSVLKAGYDNKFDPTKRIQLCMSQTFYARLDKVSLKADYVIQDEGHREFKSKRTTAILYHLQYKSRLLFSGTCYDSNGFQFEGTIDTFKTVPMETLIERGKLSSVKYFVPKWANNIDYDSVKLVGGEYNTTNLEEIINSNSHLKKVLNSMNFMNAKNKKTLVFCSSIEQCDLVTAMLKADGYLVEASHSFINKKDDEAVLYAFKNDTVYAGALDARKELSLFDGDKSLEHKIMCLVSVNKLGIGFSVENVDLGVILRPTKIRSLAVQLAGRIYRSHHTKEYGEILDLAQIVKTFGFAHEEYIAPKHTGNKQLDKILIETLNKKHALDKLDIILEEDPTEVTRELYELKLKELREIEIEFIRNKDEFRKSLNARIEKENKDKRPNQQIDTATDYMKRIANIINTTDNFYALISAGAEFWTIMHGKPISKAGKVYSFNAEWLCENITVMINKYPEKLSHWIKAYRTRVKNICKSGGNYNSIKFFIDFLAEEYEKELEIASHQESSESQYYMDDEDEQYIPF